MTKKTVTKKQPAKKARGFRQERNNSLADSWSLMHLLSGIAFGWVMSPLAAMVILILWEPLENFIISPIAARYNIEFGYETLRNSLSDIVIGGIGVLLGYAVLTEWIAPPFHLF